MPTIPLEILDDQVFMALEEAISAAEAAATNGTLPLISPPAAKRARTCQAGSSLLQCTTSQVCCESFSSWRSRDIVIGQKAIPSGNPSTSNNHDLGSSRTPFHRTSRDVLHNGGRGSNGFPPGSHAGSAGTPFGEPGASSVMSSNIGCQVANNHLELRVNTVGGTEQGTLAVVSSITGRQVANNHLELRVNTAGGTDNQPDDPEYSTAAESHPWEIDPSEQVLKIDRLAGNNHLEIGMNTADGSDNHREDREHSTAAESHPWGIDASAFHEQRASAVASSNIDRVGNNRLEIRMNTAGGSDNQSEGPEDSAAVENHPWGIDPSTLFRTKRLKFPYLLFKNRIVYSRTMSEAEAAASNLLRRLKSEKAVNGASMYIGFDAEWKVNPSTKEIGKVAVVQLCMDAKQCEVFHLTHSGVPYSLRIILEDPSFIKVGVAADGDARRLRTDYNINVRGVEDLASLAQLKLGGSRRSLACLTEEVLHKKLDKNPKIRCGDWGAEKLSKDQLQYAATDAFASFHLFQILSAYSDFSKREGGILLQ